MRGAHCLFGHCICQGGIIPADAGSTGRLRPWQPSSQDHPRGCGEHASQVAMPLTVIGSSPRMRGAPYDDFDFGIVQGIIPADAGSTQPLAHTDLYAEDHPRGCGEHVVMGYGPNVSLGSSPRMRGARLKSPFVVITRRIIPADAGSTEQAKLKSAAVQDHPRGCGEHFSRSTYLRSTPGSSPRMRGARMARTGKPSHWRIIPADAGSTTVLSSTTFMSRDHPRGCGEHWHQVR